MTTEVPSDRLGQREAIADPKERATLGDEFLQRSHEVLAGLRDRSPVRRVVLPDGEGWLITRLEDLMALSADPRVSRDLDRINELERAQLASSATPPEGAGGEGTGGEADPYGGYGWIFRGILYMDPPDHTRLRRLVSKAFTPRMIDALRPRLEQIADDLLARLTGPEPVDLLPAFAVPLPMTAISELLGVPEEDRPNFWAWSHAINGLVSATERIDALGAAAEYLGALAERKRVDPGPDLMSHMVQTSEDGDRLSREELISMALLMLLAGHDTTVGLIANGTLAFLRAPEQLALLRANPALLPNAVEEVLRFDSPVNISSARVTLAPIELSGVRIPAGEMLFISVVSANRDPGKFAAPDTFDISRDTRGHFGFGHGIHYCLGAPLARLEGEIAFRQLFGRFPRLRLAVAPEALTYRASTLMHSPVSLPVYLGGELASAGR